MIVDGDRVGLADRLRLLCGDPDRREDTDRIAIWVPTWSIETWILWLSRRQVNGAHVHERMGFKTAIRLDEQGGLVLQAVRAWDRPDPDEATHVPSLSAARRESARLPAD